MNRTEVQLSLVQSLLAAPGSTEGWELFLTRLCDVFHGSAAKFIAHSVGSHHALAANVSVAVRTDVRAVDEYQQHWYRYDPWRNAMSPEVQPGTVVVGDELIGRDQISRTAFYSDFARKYESTQCLAGILELSSRSISNISINRPDSIKRFDEDDASLLGWLMPHLSRAIEIHRRLCGAELMTAHTSAALDVVPFGIILVAESGAVLSMNRAAQMILRARDGLICDRDGLHGATPSITARLRAAMHCAIRMSNGEALDGEIALPLPRPSGRRPLSMLVAPLPAARVIFTSAAAAVFVTDPDAATNPVVKVIQNLYDLTRGESKLVQCLVRGLSVEEAAAELGLKPHTTRSRLKIVFEKTNTHRQAELVRLVLTSAAALG